MRFIILLIFAHLLAPPTFGSRFSACQTLCGGLNNEMDRYYPGFYYKLPDFTKPNRPSLSGRFFGIQTQEGWETYQSDEVEEKEGYNILHRYGQKFATNVSRTHHAKKKGGQTIVKIGLN